jgi:hypothetical protein
MPVILRQRGYAFFFVMFDLSEPIHVHVRHGRNEAKFWIQPISLAWNRGYRSHELSEIERIIEANHPLIHEAWMREMSRR